MILLALLLTQFSQSSFDGNLIAEMVGRPEREKNKISYEGAHTFRTAVEGTAATLKKQSHEFKASFVLWQNYETKWKLTNSTKFTELKTNARFPNGTPLPHQLWDLETQISYFHKKENNHSVAIEFGVGSNSNRPYGALRDSFFEGNFVYHIPKEDESGWLYFVNFSNNRTILNAIPFPGFAYYFKTHANLRLIIGLPIFVAFWSPLPKLVTSLSYFPLRNLRFKTSYFLFGPTHLFLEIEREEYFYRISDRQNKKERFFSENWVSRLGAQMPLEKYIIGQISLNRTFQSKVFLGEKSKDRNGLQNRSLKNAWAIEALLQSAF